MKIKKKLFKLKMFFVKVFFGPYYLFRYKGRLYRRVFFSGDYFFFRKFLEQRVYPFVKIIKKPKDIDLLIYEPHRHEGYGRVEELKKYHVGALQVRDYYAKLAAKAKFFWNGENTALDMHYLYDDYFLTDFDYAVGFKRDSDKTLYFPIWLMFLFNGTESRKQIYDKVREINTKQYKKTKFCALVANHDHVFDYGDKKWGKQHVPNVRTKLFDMVSKIEHVNAPSKLFHNDDNLKGKYKDNKKAYLREFKFTICPENTKGEGYITEKLFEAFEAGCIPIYWGVVPEEIQEFVNPDSYLYYNGKNEKEIVAEIKKLNEDEDYYSEFMSREKLKPEIVDFIDSRFKTLEKEFRCLLEL